MRFAEVAVDAPVGFNRTFSYSVPPNLHLEPGQAVWVPFGPRTIHGIVLELVAEPAVPETRPVTAAMDPRPLLFPWQLSLGRWLSENYLTPLFDCLSLMFPPGFRRKLLTYYEPSTLGGNGGPASLNAELRYTWELIKSRERWEQEELEQRLGRPKAGRLLSQLVKKRLVTRAWEWARPRVSPKMVSWATLTIPSQKAMDEAVLLRKKRAEKQADLLTLVATEGQVPLRQALAKTGASSVSARGLAKRGLIGIEERQELRDPLKGWQYPRQETFVLTQAQEAAAEAICGTLNDSRARLRTFLMHGVTGSGKTEVYLRSLEEALRLGKRGIVLVPEISLTPQAIDRFGARFSGNIAVLHSRLSPGQQFDEWWRIKESSCPVVIGPRSAIFAPQGELGLIIVDEEHDGSFKQEDLAPRYHARDAALKLAELTGAVVVLGSATPSLESFYQADRGIYRLLSLPERVPGERASRSPASGLPSVEIVDLREELKAGNRSIFSRRLRREVEEALDGGEQAILFLNRRGAAPFVTCRDCGFVVRCSRCELPMTYHGHPERLVCHHCNQQLSSPSICPKCGSLRIRFFGVGTQKVQEEAAKAFPGARLLRWDRDVAFKPADHAKLLRQFQNREADILIGTQMIAKGLDFPDVGVVGVISADMGLHLPDFRAGEHTFQLMCQVAGRAGRGERPGRVIIQTYDPSHYAIAQAAYQDYNSFFREELAFRREHGYPPFARLARLLYQHTNYRQGQAEVARVYRILLDLRDAQGLPDTSFIGPSSAYPPRLRDRYRWHLIVRTRDPSELLKGLSLPRGWAVDVDPVSFS